MGKTDENRAREDGYVVAEGHDDVYLHRMILGISPDDRDAVAEHINGDLLDNRRANLRLVD